MVVTHYQIVRVDLVQLVGPFLMLQQQMVLLIKRALNVRMPVFAARLRVGVNVCRGTLVMHAKGKTVKMVTIINAMAMVHVEPCISLLNIMVLQPQHPVNWPLVLFMRIGKVNCIVVVSVIGVGQETIAQKNYVRKGMIRVRLAKPI